MSVFRETKHNICMKRTKRTHMWRLLELCVTDMREPIKSWLINQTTASGSYQEEREREGEGE